MVVAGRTQGDQPGAASLQLGEYRCRQVVVDEGTDHLTVGRQGGGFAIQTGLEKVQVVAVGRVGGHEAVAIVGLAAEQGDAHGRFLLSMTPLRRRGGQPARPGG
ncbi:hypothetical protein D3C80_1954830 [compost metagenome]